MTLFQIVTIIIAILTLCASLFGPFVRAWIDKEGISIAIGKIKRTILKIVFYLPFVWLTLYSVYRFVQYLPEPTKPLEFYDFLCFSVTICNIFGVILSYIIKENSKIVKSITNILEMINEVQKDEIILNERILNKLSKKANKPQEKP